MKQQSGATVLHFTKAKWNVIFYINPASLLEALIQPVHSGPTVNDIFPKLNNVKYFTLTDESLDITTLG